MLNLHAGYHLTYFMVYTWLKVCLVTSPLVFLQNYQLLLTCTHWMGFIWMLSLRTSSHSTYNMVYTWLKLNPPTPCLVFLQIYQLLLSYTYWIWMLSLRSGSHSTYYYMVYTWYFGPYHFQLLAENGWSIDSAHFEISLHLTLYSWVLSNIYIGVSFENSNHYFLDDDR